MSHKGKEVMMAEEEEDPAPTSHPAPGVAGESLSAPDPAAPKKMVMLLCSDGHEFAVEESLAMGSEPIKNMIMFEDGCTDTAVPLPNVTGDMLAKVVEYWRRHAQGDEGSKEIKEWDANFVKVDEGHDDRFELALAANYLGAKPLLDLLCQAVADTIKDFTVEQLREYFDIENDFTPEEEAKIREENKWAFE